MMQATSCDLHPETRTLHELGVDTQRGMVARLTLAVWQMDLLGV
jgi:hypothetical protein